MNISQTEINQIISDSIFKQLGCKDEQIVVLYDEDCELAKIVSDAHKEVLGNRKNTLIRKYNADESEELVELLTGLEKGSSVILIQSSSFRLDKFRIRLQLFNKGIGCIEHSHLAFYDDDQKETWLKSLTWNGEEYARLGDEIAKLMRENDEIIIYSGENEKLIFPDMDEAKINDGRFYQQKNRGGSSICGEIFSEAKDLRSVNGTLSINCFPDSRFKIKKCENFTITIENGCITKWDNNAPDEFIENIIERVQESEVNEEGEPEVMIREAGFGLNPFISLDKPLNFVSIFERQAGFHVSVGKKHNVYRKKLGKKIIQRYHIDIFADCKKMTAKTGDKEIVFFENGKYII